MAEEDKEITSICPRRDPAEEQRFFDWADETTKKAVGAPCPYVNAMCKAEGQRTELCRHYLECRMMDEAGLINYKFPFG